MTVQTSTKFLFIPVSSAEGIGEYMRSMIIADEVKRLWPSAEIKFILSQQAPYAAQCPYPAVLLEDTPTKQVKAVNQVMSDYLPDIVLFDASGRKSQLAHAHKLGAKVIFLSQHKRKRSRGMKIGRALVTDCHWVVQPEFVIGPISWLDRLKLKLINKPAPLNIGPVFTQPDASTQSALLAQYQLTQNEFVLFNAGSGGHKLNGELAADIFAQAAHESYKASGITSVMVFGPNYPNPLPELEGVVVIPQLNNQQFINMLAAAKAAVLSGGDTLLQAIALRKPTLAVPVSKDQPPRIAKCVSANVALGSVTELDVLNGNIKQLLSSEGIMRLATSLEKDYKLNGLDLVMKQLERWIRL
ncbi:hypothetical protein [Shewanella baltica]|uniref:Glycosyl transferase family 28 C-terminal domain-containing protein n=1 Tax=Shewanella baltica (strain OS155 / ATCC BAA-1091) TaxID=325240 RepID=A3CYN6_SHEB5|nr:hypothetical protein [Shewanella baltica]ABN59599.1 conserved hypothetical protein [Shewanella baltica OS155]AEH11868.1 hypothetical protein Sbal117_0063 [Shewanella baltica OS117]